MPPNLSPPSALRAVRILHGALVIGLGLVGATFFLVTRTVPPLGYGPTAGYATAAFALMSISVSLAYLWPRMPERAPGQAPDEYWATPEVRGRAIAVWAVVQAAGLVSWVGYLMSRTAPPVATACVAILALIIVRPRPQDS